MKPVDNKTRNRLIDAAVGTLTGTTNNPIKQVTVDSIFGPIIVKTDPTMALDEIRFVQDCQQYQFRITKQGLMQLPTIGRIVHYTLSEFDKTTRNIQNNGAGECPAVIVRVWNDSPNSLVNLRLLTDSPEIPWLTSVPMGDGPGQWRWLSIPQLGGGDKHR